MSDFVTVAAYATPWEAHIAKGRLESEGVPVFIAHEQHVWLNWMYSNALGGVKLRVASVNAERAGEIINAVASGECEAALRKEIPSTQDNLCPECKNLESTSRFSAGTIALIFLMYFAGGVIFPARRELHTCSNCGHQWRY